MTWRAEEIDAELKRLESVCAAFGASAPQGNDHLFWRKLLREVDVCVGSAVRILAQVALQHDETRSREMMERLDRLDELAGAIRQRLDATAANTV
jgi:hypothetical protein